MTGKTHMILGATTAALLARATGQPESTMLLMSAVGAVAALIPDVDMLVRKINLGWVVRWLPVIGHRGITHSGLAIVAVLVVAVLINHPLAWGSAVGYLSHLVADAMTVRGVPLLYPHRRQYHALPKILTITTGSMFESLIWVAALVGLIAVWLGQQRVEMIVAMLK